MRMSEKAKSHDVPAADTGDDAEVDEEERGSDEPVKVTGNKKLPAIGGDNPATAGGHGEVGDGRDTSHESGGEEHTARGLALGSVDADEQSDAREHDENELQQRLAEG